MLNQKGPALVVPENLQHPAVFCHTLFDLLMPSTGALNVTLVLTPVVQKITNFCVSCFKGKQEQTLLHLPVLHGLEFIDYRVTTLSLVNI